MPVGAGAAVRVVWVCDDDRQAARAAHSKALVRQRMPGKHVTAHRCCRRHKADAANSVDTQHRIDAFVSAGSRRAGCSRDTGTKASLQPQQNKVKQHMAWAPTTMQHLTQRQLPYEDSQAGGARR